MNKRIPDVIVTDSKVMDAINLIAGGASKLTREQKHARMMERIETHGRNLLAIFPQAKEPDPVKLCKKLRRLEAQAAAIGLRMCNGPEFEREEEPDELCEAILAKVDALLGFTAAGVPVFVNRDPRGYALKIEDEWMSEAKGRDEFYDTPARRLHRDWGGYGILAPDLTEED